MLAHLDKAFEHTDERPTAAIGRLVDAGADSVVLVPLPDKNLAELDLFAGRLLPLL